jgi:hypothetical protein
MPDCSGGFLFPAGQILSVVKGLFVSLNKLPGGITPGRPPSTGITIGNHSAPSKELKENKPTSGISGGFHAEKIG